jgi:hypothetical protein
MPHGWLRPDSLGTVIGVKRSSRSLAATAARRRWSTLVYGLLLLVGVAWVAPVLAASSATSMAPAPAPAKPAAEQPAAKQPAPKRAAKQQPPAKGSDEEQPAGEIDPSALESQASTVRETEIYGDRLDGLQAEVNDLKDRIFRSKARLALLRETVLRGVMAGSRVVLTHRNLMGSGFRLVKIVYVMDGAQIFARSDETGALDSEDELVVYDGNVPPGPHNVTVELTYKGHGYGVFSYLNNYTFESRSSHSFVAPENGAVKLASIGFERGNVTTELKDRPGVDFREIPLDSSGRPLAKRKKRSK